MTTWSDYPVGEYVTEISVPDFGDGGIQRLHSKPLGGKGEKEMSEDYDNPKGFMGWVRAFGVARAMQAGYTDQARIDADYEKAVQADQAGQIQAGQEASGREAEPGADACPCMDCPEPEAQ